MPFHDPDSGIGARATLRHELRRRRSGMAPAQARRRAASAARHLCEAPEFRHAHSVAGYVAVRGELDPMPVLRRALADGKAVYLPRVVDATRMVFARWESGDELHTGRYAIPEPAGDAPTVAPEDIDLVVVPLLGFDARGVRLGNGAGYYDRAFAFKRAPAGRRPLLAGVAYALQQCPALEAASWDVPLDVVATEQGVIRIPPNDTGEGE